MRNHAEAAIESLRVSTRSRHESLDQTLSSLFDPVTRETLDLFHQTLAEVVSPIERALERREWPAELEIRSRLRRRDWLANDGYELAEGVSSLPVVSGHGWGLLYVLEGSTLGGNVLSRSVKAAGLESRYLEGYGEDTGKRWKRFRHLLDESLRTPREIDQARGSANELFDTYSRAFARKGLAA